MIGPLRDRSLSELVTRARQAAVARLGRIGLEPRLRPTDRWLRGLREPIRSEADLLDWLRYQAPFHAPGGATSPVATADAVARRHPTEVSRLRERANAIVEGRFDLLGHEGLSFGDPIDWSLDPTTGVRAPEAHWSRIDNLDASAVGDHKVTWELNRQQYLHLLARESLLTGDDRYARVAMGHLDAWMRGNPPQAGINWSSSLELAYRSIAWLWALLWLRDAPLDPGLVARAVQYLELHGRHVETHLSTYYSPNTHLTGEALGLLYLGTLLPILPAAQRWRTLGWEILVSAVDRHVEPDGTYFERTTYYHRYTVDIYTHALLLGRGMPDDQRARVQDALDRLLDHAMAVTRPDGGTPLVGDDDGGHLWMPRYDRPDDFRPSLSNGGVLLGRDDLAWVAGGLDPETLWLLGPDAADAWDRLDPDPPAGASRAFPDGGYYVLRDGWNRDALYMLFDAGPHGALNCGHAHADALSFELAAAGAPLLVDPGTCSYADTGSRDAFRGAGAHNTATVAGSGGSVPAGPFQWARRADVAQVRWYAGEAFDYIDGTVDLAAPGARHRREVLFARGTGWLLRDRLQGAEGARARMVFQGAPGHMDPLDRAGVSAAVRYRSDAGPGLDIQSWGTDLTGCVEPRSVSPIHGRRNEAPAWLVEAPVDNEIVTLLLPELAREPTVVKSECTEAGLHLRIRAGSVIHDIWSGPVLDPAPESPVAHASLIWRIVEENDSEARLAAVDADHLELDGTRFPDPGTGPCTEARRTRGSWHIMTRDS